MKIAIFGLHAGTQASYVPSEWDQVWRMAHDPEAPQAHRIFEAHSEPIARKYGGDAYLAKLAEYAADGLLTTLWPYATEWGESAWGGFSGYWKPQSSISYMAHMALFLRANHVGLFGVDMADGEEYGYQRPDIMRLVGFSAWRKALIHIDPASSLLKSQWTAGIYGHPDNIDDMVYRLS